MTSLPGLLGYASPSGLLGPQISPINGPSPFLFGTLSRYLTPLDEPRTPFLDSLRPFLNPIDGPPAPRLDSPTAESLDDSLSPFAPPSAFPSLVRGQTFRSVAPPIDLPPWLPDIGLIDRRPTM